VSSSTNAEGAISVECPVCWETPKRAFSYVLGFFVFNLALRLAILNINTGEYTDGILQLLVFKHDYGLYPPLYGGLCSLISLLGPGLETSARLVSAVASAAAVIPIYLLARRLHGDSAARFAAVFYSVCPLVLRWSVRVMTDSLFLCLVSWVMWYCFLSWDKKRAKSESDRDLALASVLSAAAAVTRYQGAFLAIVLLLPLIGFVRRFRAVPWRAVLASLIWIALPGWILTHGFVHGQQFADRTAGQWIATLLSYLNLFESFILILPYFFGFPLFLFFLAGLWRGRFAPGMFGRFLALFFLWSAIILVLQSVFGSFQDRYMLPLFPLLLTLAGAGAAWAEHSLAACGRGRLFSTIFLASLVYLVFFSSAIMVFQRGAFGDQKQAAQFIRDKVSENAPLLSNEMYGSFQNIECVKLSFWSGRRVQSIYKYLPSKPVRLPEQYLPPGSVVIIGNVYGGDQMVDLVMDQLAYFYHIRLLASFDSSLYPITDDLMVNPIANQNPIGWVLRYTLQTFTTHVYVVDGRRSPEELKSLLQRQLGPPGTQAIRGPDGRLMLDPEMLKSMPHHTTSSLEMKDSETSTGRPGI
jgi:hypothetical protein